MLRKLEDIYDRKGVRPTDAQTVVTKLIEAMAAVNENLEAELSDLKDIPDMVNIYMYFM